MNAKRILSILGLGAAAAALIALPGSSALRQDPKAAPAVDCSQSVSDTIKVCQDVRLALLDSDLADLDIQDGDDEPQVFVTSGQGWLGVGVNEVTPDKAKELHLPAERGVLLGKIVPDSPAAKAGLKENDVVTEVNGQRIEGAEQFRRMVREIPSGRAAQFTVWRDGRSQTLGVTIGKSESHRDSTMVSPGTFAFHMPDMSHLPELNGLMDFGPFAGHPRLGIDAEDLEGDFGNFFGAPEGQGVLVRGVFADSPAAKAGLKVGDVITTVDGDRVHSVGELREKLAAKHSAKSVNLGLLRNKAPLKLSVDIPAPADKHEHHNSVRTNI